MNRCINEGYLTDSFTEEGVQFIARNQHKPFFLYLSYNAVHSPWQAPENVAHKVKHISNPNRRTYAGMLVSMDDGVGRIIQSLKDAGVYENTVVIFLIDNGAPYGSSASGGSLRGNKGDTYVGGTRVPFVISWPGQLPEDVVFYPPVSALDLAPTIVQLAGGEAAKKGFDGVDLLPFLRREKQGRPHKTMFFRRDNDYALRDQDWKLAWNNGAPTGSKKAELFNLAEDPNEVHDLIHTHPEKVAQLQRQFDAWDSPLPDNLWWGGPSNRKRASR